MLVVTPADQTVTNGVAFTQALRTAVEVASSGAIVILGITPDTPETGYGYIRSTAEHGAAAKVAQFVEKPNAATAARYLAEGGCAWNSALFVLKASTWLAAPDAFRPDISAATRAAWSARSTDGPFVRPDKAAFATAPTESVDYAVMERCPGSAFDIRVVPWLRAGTTSAPGTPSSRCRSRSLKCSRVVPVRGRHRAVRGYLWAYLR